MAGAHRVHRRDPFGIVRRLAGLTTAFGMVLLFSSLFIAPAVGVDDPVIVPGNPKCEVGEFSFKDDNGPLSPATNGEVGITYSDQFQTTVTAADGFVIDQVIVKAGSSAAIYSTPPFTDLASIINDGGQLAAISHVEVCYSTAATTTTSEPTTTTTEPTTTTTEPTTTTTEPTTTTTAPTTTTTAPTTTTTAPTTTTTEPATTTTDGSTTTTVAPTTSSTGGTTTTTEGATTTTDGATTTSESSSNTGTPPVSVLPTEIDQTELPLTGIGDGWTAALGAVLVIIGAGILVFIEHEAKARRTALLRRL